MTAPTPQPDAERVQAEATAAVERGAEAVMGLTSLGSTRNLVEAALAAALDVEEMARVISAHRHGSQVAWDEDRRIATALRAAILGGAA